MNLHPGLIGKKLGNTQIFGADGQVQRVTAIEAGPCILLRKRTLEKDGYTALQVGFGSRRADRVNKPEMGVFNKLGFDTQGRDPVRVVREFRVAPETLGRFEEGQSLTAADLFSEGQFVDVCGVTRGRGFSGVMRRHGFAGAASQTHGTHEYKRHGGSIGTNMTPGRTFPNLRMPGQYGAERMTVLNLRVIKVLPEENLVLVEGAVPGPRRGIVTVRHAVKKKAPAKSSA